MPSASATAISRDSASASIIVPVGLAGLAITTPLSGVLRCAAISAFADSAQRVSRRRFDQHRLAAKRGQDVPVGRIAGIGQRHAVARFEQRQKRQDEAAGRAGRHHDARGIEVETVGFPIMTRDARPQRRDAERLGIADAAVRERGLRRPRSRVAGAGAAGWPTSIWTTRPPVASRCAAAAITSMTMKGGTSLRLEGINSCFAASSMVFSRRACRPAPLLPHSAACWPADHALS